MPENPDAEKAALAEALKREVRRRFHPQGCPYWKSCGEMACTCGAMADWQQTDVLLADLSPAAKEIARKAQAHDRQAKLIRLLLPDSLLREVMEEWPARAHREAAEEELQRRAALKEPE